MRIINSARSKNRQKFQGEYFEKHHILPRSLFPLWQTKPSNEVLLTPREHFFCHQLLQKIYDSNKMKFAMWRISNRLTKNGLIEITSKQYQKIKEDILPCLKELNKGRSENGKNYHIICLETQESFVSIEKAKLKYPKSTTIKGAIKTGGKSGGFHWRRIDKTSKEIIEPSNPHNPTVVKIANSMRSKGRSWYNDGKNSFFLKDSELKEILFKGRIYDSKPKTNEGKHWYNDGIKSFMLKESEVPINFNKGRINY